MKHTLKGKGREVAFGPLTQILLEKDHGHGAGRPAAAGGAELHVLYRGAD